MLKRLSLALLVLFSPVFSFATADVSITPVSAHFAPGEKIETLTFKNKGDDSITLQAQFFSWSQKDGQNIYQPTKDVFASPAMFTLKPGEKQLLRVALRKSTNVSMMQQQTYRVFFTQILPRQVKQVAPEQVNTKLKISLPIFLDIDAQKEKVALTAKESHHQVILTNAGNVTRLINQIRWMKEDGTTPIAPLQNVFIYLLPGSSYTLATPAQSHTLQVLTNRKLETLQVKS